MYLHPEEEVGMVEDKGIRNRCFQLRSNRKKEIGRVDTYLENILTTISWN